MIFIQMASAKVLKINGDERLPKSNLVWKQNFPSQE